MVKTRIKHIVLILTMLLLGGITNEAWGYKVTYHILTLPFTTKNSSDGVNLTDRFTNIRVEAIRVIVDDATTVGLPPHFMSPLAENFKYYASANVTRQTASNFTNPQNTYFDGNGRAQIYQYMTTKYDLYAITTDSPINPADYTISSDQDIYVTYTYKTDNTIAKLDGSQHYNIKLGDRFLCFNRDRANRPGAILASNLTEENLTSNDFTYVAKPGFNNNTHHNFHFRFKFEGNDPYNIVLRTSYNGDATFMESDKALNKKVKKYYRGASLFLQGKQDASNNMWLASDDEIQYTQTNEAGVVTSVQKPGFYRGGNGGSAEMNPIWNSFAMLNADNGEGYVFMATKVNTNGNDWQPGGKKGGNNNEFLYLTGNVDSGNNPRFQWKTAATAESTPEQPYEIRTYTYKVKSPLTNTPLEATVEMSEYEGSATLLTHVPDKLKRKYATFTGAYKEEGLSTSMTTFADVETANNGRVIWLKYESSMPFESLPAGGSYEDARWYTIRMNGQAENQYVAFYDTSNDNQFSTGRGSNSDLHQGENSAEAQVAFIGDPFELKIISRKTSEDATAAAGVPATAAHNRYIGCATSAANGDALSSQTGSIVEGVPQDISSWEIEADNVSGTMVLRQFNTYDAPKYIGWNYGSTGNPMSYKIKASGGEASRIKVVELEKKKYLYHIVRSDGTVAVKASSMQDVGIRLDKTRIPEIISSPFVGTMTFYATKANADAGTSPIVDAPYVGDNVTDGIYANIYIRYTVASDLSGNYNVRLNGEYIYWDTESASIKSVADIDKTKAENSYYQWHLTLTDPYAMLIKNVELGKYVNVSSWANKAALDFDVTGSMFIAQSANNVGVYEVMAATGGALADPDASETYYHIGRNDDTGTCIYSNAKYQHFDNALRFRLTATLASNYTYHLIDKSGTDLLTVVTRQISSDAPRFPTDYYSPLVASYHYYLSTDFDVTDGKYTLNGGASELATVGENGHIYVTYDVNNTINLQKGVLYLLKFRTGDSFYQEDGADGLTKDPVQAIYPYCNGDCNFFVYGQDEYELQQQGAASTRTRWAWYLESANNDPYHVKICSRQQETYPAGSTNNYNGYFRTYVQNYGGRNHVVTNLAWYGITGIEGTDYMILGATGQYQLMTSELINDGTTNERRVVKSFEQYWKTFDTVRKNIYGESSAKALATDPTTVPADVYYKYGAPTAQTLRNYLETDMHFHPYVNWAYAKRWNGYNKEGKTSKGWEEIEHWYQTVNMGDGYFDLVKTTIDPALILIDQHGWEIMRKPLPSSPDDPYKETKYNAIRPYNSPMVKEYIFWSSAKKRTGMHQYYLMDKRIGGDYTSTDLTQLPPYGSENVLDAKGNLNDQYVTYIVKDEYAQSYVPSSKAGASFLIQQGNNFASNDGTSTIQSNTVPSGGMSQYIIDNISTIYDSGNAVLWYVKPNSRIDYEMGYIDEDKENSIKSNHDWGTSTPNAYGDAPYSTNRTAVIIEGSSSDATIKKYGRFSFSNGFDPYNIQITSVSDNTKYFVTNTTTATLEEGSCYGNGSSVTLGAQKEDVTATWYDNLTQHPTNATFMAVQDADGNMQLMPRFDHDRRVSGFSSLVNTGVADANTHTKFYRPMVYNYHIVDNSGHESLRYRSAGELTPYIPNHFKSPLAKDYKYYKDLTLSDDTYTEVSTKADISSKEITEPLAAYNELTQTNIDGNVIYVRYTYNEEADVNQILKGKWFTMQLNTKDAIYNSGIKQADISKPASVNADYKNWQWKLLETRVTDPDPYAVYLFNRSQTEGTKAIDKRFALLSHTSGGYALAEAGTASYTYTFLNGASMTTSVVASTATEAGFQSMSCAFDGTKSQVKLLDDVEHEYTYKVYTNGTNGINAVKYGILAISGTQSQAEASQNEFVPVIPEAIRTPLLEPEEFLFYEKETDMGDDTKELPYLYGLYDDVVYVRYGTYDETKSSFRVPNSKTTEGTPAHVARADDSNDAALVLSGNVLYNIIWYNDEMMRSYKSDIDGGSTDNVIRSTTGQNVQAVEAYEWRFEGNDPYAIKIKSEGVGKYIHKSSSTACNLDEEASATTFMLIPRGEDYPYGVLATTEDATTMLSGYGNELITSSDPTKFIPFALSTHKVIYHLVLKHINDASTLTIPYRKGTVESPEGDLTTMTISGSTLRDLTTTTGLEGAVTGDKYQLGETISLNGTKTTYCVDAGHISLGDVLKVPTEFYRPNVTYSFIVEGVYSDEACTAAIDAMNTKYKGFAIDKMGDDTGLLGRTVLINIVYGFQTGLDTNSGSDFVTAPSQNKWYTLESKVGDTPWLAQYTNAWGLEVKAGRGTHYTNDYLWSPVGDPYGFVFYNRYIYKNSGNDNAGEIDKIMVPTSAPTVAYSADITINKGKDTNANGVYELLSAPTDGYFRIHPVVNKDGDQYYFKTVNDGASGIHIKLSNTPTEFTFGLSKELFDPYFRYVGYVGALKKSVCDANATLVAAMKSDAELTSAQLMAAQTLVYDDSNLEPFVAGYYRLHSPSGIEGIDPIRYASGYTHKTELTNAIPMHFYEKEGVETTFDILGGGYTTSNATRGDIPIPAVEYDPASIFYITYNDANNNNSNVVMSTQGLYVKGATAQNVAEGDGVRAKVYMTATADEASALWLMDIGGGVFLIHDRTVPANRKYLSYHQDDGANIYDLKLTHNTHTDHAKWCLQPANNLGLKITTHSGGDEAKRGTSYNYASVYYPFDIMLPDDNAEKLEGEDYLRVYQAFLCESVNSPWSPPSDLHPKSIGRYNTGTYAGNNKFVPAGTPALLAMWDQTDVIKVTIPTSSPSTSLISGFTSSEDGLGGRDNILSGEYLEQKLDPGNDVYVFGLPLKGTIVKDNDDPSHPYSETGNIKATLPSQDNVGLGFYLNANPNKEENGSRGGWIRNNWYVLSNKVYYRAPAVSPAPAMNRAPEFVPVIFDDEEQDEELKPDGTYEIIGDGCVYDLMGRKVATREQVEDGSWKQRVASGIYILNGKKFQKK